MNPQYVYIDGHDSHWDATALRYLRDNNIYVCFLKANDSANDQPNDMGPNAALKAHYATRYSQHCRRYPGVTYTTLHFNSVCAAAYQDLLSSPTIASTVMHAFKKAGLHPMERLLASDKL